MTLDKVFYWLQTNITADIWSAGRLVTGEKQLVVYPGSSFTNPRAIGQQSSYRGYGVRVLIHWNKNILDTELKAKETYEFLRNAEGTLDGKRIIKTDMRDADPVPLGADESGVFEFVIDLEIIIER